MLRPQFGAVIWAAVDKSPGFTPKGLVVEIRRNVHYPTADWRAVLTEEPLDPQDISRGSGRPLTRLKPLWCGYRLTKWGCYLYRKGRWCNPPPTIWRRTRPMPDIGAATGPPAPTSPPPCSSITNTHQALHNVSSRVFCPLCKNQDLCTERLAPRNQWLRLCKLYVRNGRLK